MNLEYLRPSPEKHRPKLEYNLAGGLILTTTEEGLTILANAARGVGFPVFSGMPFRGHRKNHENLPIVHLEAAWNPTNQDNFLMAALAGMAGHIKRAVGAKNQSPILQDALFPGRERSNFLLHHLLKTHNAKLISHKILPHRLIETPKESWLLQINSAVEKNPEELIAWTKETGVKLVFDPSHLGHWFGSKTISAPNNPIQPYDETIPIFYKLAEEGIIEVVDLNSQKRSLFNSEQNKQLLETGVLKELIEASTEYESIEYLRLELPIAAREQLITLISGDKLGPAVSLMEMAAAIEQSL